jgi:hypothetical protein
MPKATSTTTTAAPTATPALPSTSRRRLLAGSGIGAILAGIGAPAAAATPTVPHPDADLIATCAEHVVNREAYNASGGELDLDDDPLWLAYARSRDAISDARPQTMEGLRAKAMAAKAEAIEPDGRELIGGGPHEYWAWDIVNDLASGRIA